MATNESIPAGKSSQSTATSAQGRHADVRWWVGTLALPIALCIVPLLFQIAWNQRAERENQFRLYTELLSKREEADMNVRRGIFDKIFDKYMPDTKDVATTLVGIELLAANFHDSLDISPLFWQLDRRIIKESDAKVRDDQLRELARIAGAVKARQIEGLELAGKKVEIDFDLDMPVDKDETSQLSATTSSATNPPARYFKVGLLKADIEGRRVLLHVTYAFANRVDVAKSLLVWADLYDFPLMSFSRLSDEERLALVLTRLDAETRSATITLIYYPSSRSGIKDKPFIDNVLSRLRRS